MITTQLKILSTTLSVYLLLSGIAFSAFSYLITISIIHNFDFTGLTAFCIFTAFSIIFIYGGLINLNRIYVDVQHNNILISTAYFLNNIITRQNSLGLKSYIHRNKFTSYKAFFIEMENGSQYCFTEFQIKNFDEIRKSVGKVIPYDKGLKRRIWGFGDKKSAWITFGIIALTYTVVAAWKNQLL